MKKMKRLTALMALAVLLALPVAATETQETLAPIRIGVGQLDQIPESWNPLEETDANSKAILEYTAEPLYRCTAQGVELGQAVEMPVDVTAEFAGSYGISPYATRGYAFAVELRPGLRWEDGSAVTVTDWVYTLEQRLLAGTLSLEPANYDAFLRGDTHPATEIISLMDAGYDSLEAAQAAGIQDFYLDAGGFWGLDTGWLRISDRTRLLDRAMPSGCEEMYVTPAYLYREYLGENGSQTMFQTEFLGVPAQPGEQLTLSDVGLLAQDNRLILILREPATVNHVALGLADLYPIPLGVAAETYGTLENYRSCGPYRVESADKQTVVLVPNPQWKGAAAEYDRIRWERAS